MRLLRPRLESGGDTLRRGLVRGRDGGRSAEVVEVAFSANEGGEFVRFRVDVDMFVCSLLLRVWDLTLKFRTAM
jgi:hypothetical protein